MNSRLRHFLRRRWLRELLVVALVFKALIPVGYMPDVQANGLPTLQLCAYFLNAGVVESPTSHDHGGGEHVDHGICPFAAAALSAVASVTAVSYRPAPAPAWSVTARAAQSHRYVSPTPHSRFARGPPTLV